MLRTRLDSACSMQTGCKHRGHPSGAKLRTLFRLYVHRQRCSPWLTRILLVRCERALVSDPRTCSLEEQPTAVSLQKLTQHKKIACASLGGLQ
jgi:hypothetical protein